MENQKNRFGVFSRWLLIFCSLLALNGKAGSKARLYYSEVSDYGHKSCSASLLTKESAVSPT